MNLRSNRWKSGITDSSYGTTANEDDGAAAADAQLFSSDREHESDQSMTGSLSAQSTIIWLLVQK